MFNFRELRFWIWVAVFFIALLTGMFANVSEAKFLSWPYMDKLAHFLYMGALATMLSRRWGMWPVIITGVLLSVGIEIGQHWTASRVPSVADALMGISGTLIAWGIYQIRPWHDLMERKIF